MASSGLKGGVPTLSSSTITTAFRTTSIASTSFNSINSTSNSCLPTAIMAAVTTSVSTNSSAPTYTNVMRQNLAPAMPRADANTEDGADKRTTVVVEVMNSFGLEDYLVALTLLVEPKDITFTSHISNNLQGFGSSHDGNTA
ncbi:hypothetical protein J437_LFUL008884 [Ladona fulva]|uniref:Uncharacterized protein n=1 Tax=Ladona fulva TaxID=123851 RepID=A0A8K0P5U0_LADFU|nr:hypothetical protein J437_LFUL008884 [Ladona fulva]